MWCWRRHLKIPWIERISNEEELRRLGSDRELLVKIRARQMMFVGYAMGRGKIEDLGLTGRIPGLEQEEEKGRKVYGWNSKSSRRWKYIYIANDNR